LLRRFHQKEFVEAGCDEAGRGCLAGPVFAAAVIIPKNFYHPLLNDSKQVAEENRSILRGYIEKKALAYAVAMVDHEEIDRINILKASFKAMHLALDQLKHKPGFLLIDGNRFTPYNDVPHACIIQGDGR
jgi:ribonuclease HII